MKTPLSRGIKMTVSTSGVTSKGGESGRKGGVGRRRVGDDGGMTKDLLLV